MIKIWGYWLGISSKSYCTNVVCSEYVTSIDSAWLIVLELRHPFKIDKRLFIDLNMSNLWVAIIWLSLLLKVIFWDSN